MPPRISICIPVYNGERHLAQALESVLAQTCGDFEVIIADDCSTDGTFDVAASFAARDQRIKLSRNERNLGLFANYNKTMAQAGGTFIKPFAQDDVWDARLLETAVAAFDRDDRLALISVQRLWIDDEGASVPVSSALQQTARWKGADALMHCLLSGANLIGEPSTVMFRRAAITEEFDCRYHHLGDLELWLRLLKTGDYLYIHEPLCRFRRHAKSSTDKNIKALLFALDWMLLDDQYAADAQSAGVSKHELKLRTAYRISTFIAELFAEGKVSVEDLLAARPSEPVERQLDQFKELAFYALLSGAQSRAQLQAHSEDLELRQKRTEQKLDDILESKIWRSTKVLRTAVGKLKGMGNANIT